MSDSNLPEGVTQKDIDAQVGETFDPNLCEHEEIVCGFCDLDEQITQLRADLENAQADAKSWQSQCDDARDMALKANADLEKAREEAQTLLEANGLLADQLAAKSAMVDSLKEEIELYEKENATLSFELDKARVDCATAELKESEWRDRAYEINLMNQGLKSDLEKAQAELIVAMKGVGE